MAACGMKPPRPGGVGTEHIGHTTCWPRTVLCRGTARVVLRLTLYDRSGQPVKTLEAADFRIDGGVIWHPEMGLIAHYSQGAWKHRGRHYSVICAEGRCRLFFGITREPSAISEVISAFAIKGSALSANGVAFAQYSVDQDVWHGVIRKIWWQALRIACEVSSPLLVSGGAITLLNPWDPLLSCSIEGITPTPASHYPPAEADDLRQAPIEPSHSSPTH
jgi:hypothetical protein